MFIKLNEETRKWLKDGNQYIIQSNNGSVDKAIYDSTLDVFYYDTSNTVGRNVIEHAHSFMVYDPPLDEDYIYYKSEMQNQVAQSVTVYLASLLNKRDHNNKYRNNVRLVIPSNIGHHVLEIHTEDSFFSCGIMAVLDGDDPSIIITYNNKFAGFKTATKAADFIYDQYIKS